MDLAAKAYPDNGDLLPDYSNKIAPLMVTRRGDYYLGYKPLSNAYFTVKGTATTVFSQAITRDAE